MGREERCEIRFSFLGWTKEGKIIRSPIEIRDSCETRSRQSRYLFLRRVAADVSNSDIYVPTSRSIAVLRAVRAYRRDGERTETRLFQSGEAVDKDRNSVLGRWQRLRTDSKSPLRCGLDIYD